MVRSPAAMTGVSWFRVGTPIGPCAVALRDGRICRVILGKGPRCARASAQVHRWLRAFFSGRNPQPPVDLSESTAFERRVYAVVRRIRPGRTLTYGEVARRVGSPGASRAVGRAMARNPIPLFIPCHRVVSAAGPGGFSAPGGVSLKLRLLSLEW